MNRSALKSAGILLLGFALGRGSGHLPGWSGATGEGKTRLTETVGQGGGPANSDNESGTGKSGQERLESEFRSLSRERGESARMGLLARIEGLSAGDADRVAEILAEERMEPETARFLAVRWAARNPQAALTFAMGQLSLMEDQELMLSLLRRLAKVNPEAAGAAISPLCGELMTNRGGPVYRELTLKEMHTALACVREMKTDWAEMSLLERMAKKEPLAAAAELVPGKRTHESVVKAIASSLLASDRAAFDAWAGELSDPLQRTVARCAALSQDAGTDPEKAARETAAWLAGELEVTEQAGELSGRVAGKWLQHEGPPAEVAAWAVTLPEGPARNEAVAATGCGWVDQDIMGASAWLSSLPQSQGRDTAVRSLVDTIKGETPADAFEWARTLGNPALRYEALHSTLVFWLEKDPAAARAAVETLPAGDQGYMMDLLRTRRSGGERR